MALSTTEAIDHFVARLRIEIYAGIQHPNSELRDQVIELVKEVYEVASVIQERYKEIEE